MGKGCSRQKIQVVPEGRGGKILKTLWDVFLWNNLHILICILDCILVCILGSNLVCILVNSLLIIITRFCLFYAKKSFSFYLSIYLSFIQTFLVFFRLLNFLSQYWTPFNWNTWCFKQIVFFFPEKFSVYQQPFPRHCYAPIGRYN